MITWPYRGQWWCERNASCSNVLKTWAGRQRCMLYRQATPTTPKGLHAGENKPGNFPRDPEEKAKLVGKDNPEIHPNAQSAPEGQVKSASGANVTYDKVGNQGTVPLRFMPWPWCSLGLSRTA